MTLRYSYLGAVLRMWTGRTPRELIGIGMPSREETSGVISTWNYLSLNENKHWRIFYQEWEQKFESELLFKFCFCSFQNLILKKCYELEWKLRVVFLPVQYSSWALRFWFQLPKQRKAQAPHHHCPLRASPNQSFRGPTRKCTQCDRRRRTNPLTAVFDEFHRPQLNFLIREEKWNRD